MSQWTTWLMTGDVTRSRPEYHERWASIQYPLAKGSWDVKLAATASVPLTYISARVRLILMTMGTRIFTGVKIGLVPRYAVGTPFTLASMKGRLEVEPPLSPRTEKVMLLIRSSPLPAPNSSELQGT